MTIDDLIAKLTEQKEQIGGDALVLMRSFYEVDDIVEVTEARITLAAPIYDGGPYHIDCDDKNYFPDGVANAKKAVIFTT